MNWTEIFNLDLKDLSSADKIQAIAALSQTVAVLLSLVALLLSLWVFSRQQRLNRWQLRLQREDHIIAWSQSCITLMAEVEEHLKFIGDGPLQSLPYEKFVKIRAELSALIDEGRLYFPNVQRTSHGSDKQEAYKKPQHPILEHLVQAYDFIGKIQRKAGVTPTEQIAYRFNEIRRAFLSETQLVVDPRLFNNIRA